MKAELLGESTYKITLDRSEVVDIPSDGDAAEMRSYICGIMQRLSAEQGINVPCGKLLAEVFLRSDGSCVFFVSVLEHTDGASQRQYYACDMSGADNLIRLCTALSATGECCGIYCGSNCGSYRIIFADPAESTERICCEFGEYCEISSVFAERTREYLEEVFSGSAADMLALIS